MATINQNSFSLKQTETSQEQSAASRERYKIEKRGGGMWGILVEALSVSLAFFTASSTRSGLIEDNPPGSWSFLSRNFASAAALFVARGPPG